MAGMRDKLIYDYFGIDDDVVWDVESEFGNHKHHQ
jgi:uncharacterized protein with HEPN domain